MEEVLTQIAEMCSEFRGELKDVKVGLVEVRGELKDVMGKFDTSLATLEKISSWHDGVDNQVLDLTTSIEAVCKKVDHVVVKVGLSALGTPPGIAASSNPPAQHIAG